jgi:hypothetical protein
MSRHNSLIPWKIAFDNASLRASNKSSEQMFQNREEIFELLKQNKSTLKATTKKAEQIRRLSEPLDTVNSTSKSIMGFAVDGQPRSFDVAIISDPFQFANDFHFDIAFLQELIPICLSSLMYLCKSTNLDNASIKEHNMRMASEIQTFVSYSKNPVDIAAFSLSLSKNKQKLSDKFIDDANFIIQQASQNIKNISFEENMFKRMDYLEKSTDAKIFFETPNDYLFSQKLGVYLGVDTCCNRVNNSNISSYLTGLCPIKNDTHRFDFLKHLFIPKDVWNIDIDYRHIKIFRALDSLKQNKHGIVDALTTQEKLTSSPLSLYRFE